MKRPVLNLSDLRLRRRSPSASPSSPISTGPLEAEPSSPSSFFSSSSSSSSSSNLYPHPYPVQEGHSSFLEAQRQASAWALYHPSVGRGHDRDRDPTSLQIPPISPPSYSDGTPITDSKADDPLFLHPFGGPSPLQQIRLRQQSFDSPASSLPSSPSSPISPAFPVFTRDPSIDPPSTLPLDRFPSILSLAKIKKSLSFSSSSSSSSSSSFVSPHAVASINLFISALIDLLTVRIALICPVPSIKDIQRLMIELLGEGKVRDSCLSYLSSLSPPSCSSSSPLSHTDSIYSFQRTRDLAIHLGLSFVRQVGKVVGKKGHVVAGSILLTLLTDPSFSILYGLMEDTIRQQWDTLSSEDPWALPNRPPSSSPPSSSSSQGRIWPVPLRRKRSALPVLQTSSSSSHSTTSSGLPSPSASSFSSASSSSTTTTSTTLSSSSSSFSSSSSSSSSTTISSSPSFLPPIPEPPHGTSISRKPSYWSKVFPIKSASPKSYPPRLPLFGRTPQPEPRKPSSYLHSPSMSTIHDDDDHDEGQVDPFEHELLSMGTVVHTHHHLDFLTSDDLYKAGYAPSPSYRSKF